MARPTAAAGFSVPHAPTFHPTLEQWANPSGYIESIRGVGQQAGICVIVPPPGWNPPFSVPEDMTFSPVVQYPRYMQRRLISKDMFLRDLGDFWRARGRPLQSRITADGVPIDVTRLYEEVGRRGGFEKVQASSEGWEPIGDCLKLRKPVPGLSLSKCYQKHLLPYELDQTGGSAPRQVYKSRGAIRKKKPLELQAEEDARLSYINSLLCSHCHFGGHEDSLVICDSCGVGTHLHCAAPPLTVVPKHEWYCERCQCALPTDVVPIAAPLHQYTVGTYREASAASMKKLFRNEGEDGETEVPLAEIERRYWEIVEKGTEDVEVEYGNDLPNDQFGSGFPRSDKEMDGGLEGAELEMSKGPTSRLYSESEWNLNNFWKIRANVLRDLDERISGVNVPWLYLGQCFSSFCWHTEDCYMYSINYHHCGAPKVWYGVPGAATEAFERVMRDQMPELFRRQPDLLFQIATMMSPRVLQQHGVPVHRAVQRPGNFIITFPQAYHAGFNSGFNCAEAMNFGLADWLPFGMRAIEHYRKYKHQSVLDMQLLVMQSLVRLGSNLFTINDPVCKRAVLLEGERLYQGERQERDRVCSDGVFRSQRIRGSAAGSQCAICRSDTNMSFLRCDCSVVRTVCLQHSKHLCECSLSSVTLHYRHSLAEFEDILEQAAGEAAPNDPATAATARLRELDKPQRGCPEKWLQYAGVWVARAQEFMSAPGSLEELDALLQQAEPFLWRGHELDHVRTLALHLETAADWGHQMMQAVVAPLDLEELQGLVGKEGWFKMPGVMAEHCQAISSAVVAKAQAERILEGLVGSEQLVQIRSMFSSVNVRFDELESRILAMETWYELATKAQPGSAAVSEGELLNVEELRHLISSASALPLKVTSEMIAELQRRCHSAEEWAERMEPLCGALLAFPQLEQAVTSHRELGVRPGETATALLKRFRDAREWLTRALGQLQRPSSTTAAELEASLQEAADLKVHFTECQLLQECIVLKQWEGRARSTLASARTPGRMELLRRLLDEGVQAGMTSGVLEKVRGTVQEYDDIILQLDQTANSFSAGERKSSYKVVAGLVQALDRHGICDDRVAELRVRVTEVDAWFGRLESVRPSRKADRQPDLKKAESVLAEGQELRLVVEEVEQLASQVKAVQEWQIYARELLSECSYKSLDLLHRQAPLQLFWVPEMGMIQPHIEKARWRRQASRSMTAQIGLNALQELLDQAKTLKLTREHPAVGETYAQVQDLLKAGSLLRARITTALRRPTPVEQLEDLLLQVEERRVLFDEAAELEGRLEEAKLVLPVLVQGLVGAGNGNELVEFMSAYKKLQQLKVQPPSEMLAAAKAVVAESEQWTRQARALIQLTDKSLKHLQEPRLFAAHEAKQFVNPSATKDCCYCGDFEYKKKTMFSCDTCSQWYHAACLDVIPEVIDSAEGASLQCPRCAQQAGLPFTFTANLRHRPSLSSLTELLDRAPRKCASPLYGVLGLVRSQVEVWEQAVAAGGEHSKLLSLALQADSFMVDPPGYKPLLLQLVTARITQKHVEGSCPRLQESEAGHISKVCKGYPKWVRQSSPVVQLHEELLHLKEWNQAFGTVLSWQLELHEYEQLMERSTVMTVLPKKHPQLLQILASAKQWQDRAASYLALEESAREPAIQELKALRDESVHLPVRLPQMADIGAAYHAKYGGRKRKPSSKFRTPVSKRARTLQTSKKENQEEEIYCVCQQAADAVECMMVICNVCKEWYHIDCIGLTEQQTKGSKHYFCEACS